MKCPVCVDAKLVSVPYEGVSVALCPSCHGFLVTKTALNNIKKNPEMQMSVLAMETEGMNDSKDVVRCPKCRIAMTKKPAPYGLDFGIDACESCNLIWLDHGELEALQIAFEETPGGRDMLERRRMMNEMSDQRREELDANIAKARDRIPNPVERGGLHFGYQRKRYSVFGALIDSFFNL